MRLAEGSPQADLRPGRLPTDFFMYIWNPRGSPLVLHSITYRQWVPNRNPLQTQGLPASRIATREAPHKQNYHQGGSPQAELQPGSAPTSRITTRELAGWRAGWRNYDQGTCHALGWLAGWLVGGLAGWLRPREAQRGGTWIDRTSLSCAWLGPETPREAQRGPERPRESQRGPERPMYVCMYVDLSERPESSAGISAVGRTIVQHCSLVWTPNRHEQGSKQ